MSLNFNRIQFTPDLMPSDITGTEILQETDQPGRRAFEFVRGRSSPTSCSPTKSTARRRRRRPRCSRRCRSKGQRGQHSFTSTPFFVLATQNPIEQEGTYPLPEAQLDRFMFLIHVGYPSRTRNCKSRSPRPAANADARQHLHAEDILRFQESCAACRCRITSTSTS
jgi:MoxR-like ATPase